MLHNPCVKQAFRLHQQSFIQWTKCPLCPLIFHCRPVRHIPEPDMWPKASWVVSLALLVRIVSALSCSLAEATSYTSVWAKDDRWHSLRISWCHWNCGLSPAVRRVNNTSPWTFVELFLIWFIWCTKLTDEQISTLLQQTSEKMQELKF